MKKASVLVLDCTPLRIVRPWFRQALQKCGAFHLRSAVPEDHLSLLDGIDSLIISGSPRDAFAADDWTHLAMKFCAEGISRGLPVLGICFGHQLLGRLHGAKVVRNPLGWEVGETRIESTGEESPLGISGRISVLESHRDHVIDLPSGCRILAGNDHTPVQAAHWADRVYSVQFHPEFTGNILRTLWKTRREEWRAGVDFDLDSKLDHAGDCKKGLAVLNRFLEMR